jgi:hypothetical protein
LLTPGTESHGVLGFCLLGSQVQLSDL